MSKYSSFYSRKSGFTLLELMISITIISIILTMTYSILVCTLNAREFLEKETHADRIGTKLLSIISRDLQAVYMYQVEDVYFLGSKTRVDFISNSDSLMFSGRQKSDLCELSYYVERNKEEAGTFQLLRREDFFLDSAPLKGGLAVKLHDRLVTFELKYLDDKNQVVDTWSSQSAKGLPRAVRVSFGIRTEPKDSPEVAAKENIRYFGTIVRIMVSPKAPPVEDKDEKNKTESRIQNSESSSQ